MVKIENTSKLSAQYLPGDRIMVLTLVLLTICNICGPANADTSIYVFDPSQSTVTQTGGFAGVHDIYGIEGKFQLTVDFDAGFASFDRVDANLTNPSGFLYTQSLGVLFNMTGLAGTIIDETTIEFEGKTTDGTKSDVSLKLSLSDDMARLTGNVTPPPNSADMFFFEIDAVATRKYAGGTGGPNNPYQIATAEDLILLGETPEDYDKHFILTADIDLDPNLPGRKVFDRAVIAPDINDAGDGFQGATFTGVFDGDGYTITNLTISGRRYLGLFGQLGLGAMICNLGLEAIDVNGTSDYIGGLAGHNEGHITKNYSTGMVHGDDEIGGLLGDNLGYVTECYSAGLVKGDESVGGLVGENYGSITTSYSTCMVSGWENVGGLSGYNSYDGQINRCFSTGLVTGAEDVGGLVSGNNVNITDCFWDMETSGQDTSVGGEGKTTAEMQTANTFLEAGWDFVGETDNGTEDIWTICEGTNYPRFVWQIPVGDFVCPDGITIDDFLFFLGHWLNDNCDSSNGYCDGTDLDRSGTVDVNDLEIFFENWPAED
jgi:hypothetical protein